MAGAEAVGVGGDDLDIERGNAELIGHDLGVTASSPSDSVVRLSTILPVGCTRRNTARYASSVTAEPPPRVCLSAPADCGAISRAPGGRSARCVPPGRRRRAGPAERMGRHRGSFASRVYARLPAGFAHGRTPSFMSPSRWYPARRGVPRLGPWPLGIATELPGTGSRARPRLFAVGEAAAAGGRPRRASDADRSPGSWPLRGGAHAGTLTGRRGGPGRRASDPAREPAYRRRPDPTRRRRRRVCPPAGHALRHLGLDGAIRARLPAIPDLRGRPGSGGRNEAFAFATRLTRRRSPWRPHPERAIQRAAAAAPDWSSGTRIGEALKTFNDRHGRRGHGPRSRGRDHLRWLGAGRPGPGATRDGSA